MKRKTKAKIKNSIISTVVAVSFAAYFIFGCALIEGFYNYIIPFAISCGILWWFAEANKGC